MVRHSCSLNTRSPSFGPASRRNKSWNEIVRGALAMLISCRGVLCEMSTRFLITRTYLAGSARAGRSIIRHSSIVISLLVLWTEIVIAIVTLP